MSVKYRDKNGAIFNLSGLTPGGNLETGAVAVRKKTVSIPSTAASGTGTVNVVFDSEMPDADYLVSVNGNTRYTFECTNLTKNGFTLGYREVYGQAVAAATNCDITAFKLYDVADAEALYSDVTDIKKMIPSNASSTNQFATINDVTGETRSLDRRLDDVEDVVPNSATIVNKLATAEDVAEAMANAGLKVTDSFPTSPQNGDVILYIGTDPGYSKGGIYQYATATNTWTLISTADIDVDDAISSTSENPVQNKVIKAELDKKQSKEFVGTMQEWNALSTEEKKSYKIANITNDMVGGEVADEVTDGLMIPVTSNAVADKLKIQSYPLSEVTLTNISSDRMSENYIHMERTGNMFKVIFDGIKFTSASSGATIITNLPAPSSAGVHSKYGFLMDNVGNAFALLQLVAGGALRVYGQNIDNQQYWGEITYFID